jgi:hypothetical protein
MSWAAEALGLPADADARAIKRAYALRLKTTRPDDDPVAFQQLYETYQVALAWAEATTWPHQARATIEDMQVEVSSLAPHTAVASLAGQALARQRRSLADLVHDPVLEAELAQWQHDGYVQDRAERILAAAHTMPAADFGPWVRALPELWSLELRPRIQQAIATQAAGEGVTMSDPALDALIACFCDEQDSEFRQALWSRRVLAITLGRSPDLLAHWLSQRVNRLSDDDRTAIGARVLRALREGKASLQLQTIDALSSAFCWSQRDHDRDDRAWLHDAQRTARTQERSRRRLAALAPDGDAAVLAYELEAAHWRKMTPHRAAWLRACLTGPPSRWGCFLSALLPARPMWMYRLCGIVDQWSPEGLPASLQPRQVRFWRQLGDRRRPHGWQVAVDLARGLAVAALIAVGAALMLPFADAAETAWMVGALATGLAIWIALVLVQVAARWQACTTLSSLGKRLAHCWALPVASIAILVGMRSGGLGGAVGSALAYIAAYRLAGRVDTESRKAIIPGLGVVGGLSVPLVIAVQAGAWPGTVVALLFWVISLIQDTQHRALQRHA